MLAHPRARSARPQRRLIQQAQSANPDTALLQMAGEIRGEHALIIGSRAVGLMCALLARGAAAATLLRPGVRPERREADLAIVPEVSDPEELSVAVAHARRALMPPGRIILRIVAGPTQRMAQAVVRALQMHGFSAVRTRAVGHCVLVASELPMFGPVPRI
jgi:threonine dehydrogenase-like Zn-dependent dehydrogenase